MMTQTYHTGRALAISVGVAATGGALAILLADPIATGNWRLDHALLPIVVAITVASGHLFGTALRQWRLLPAVGFVTIFVIGTLLTVYSSVGAQKSGAGVRQELAVSSHNGAIVDKRAELDRARLRLSQAESMADREMTGSRCGARCNDWKTRATEVQARIGQLEGELRGLGPQKVAPSKARPFAEALGVLGLDAAKVEKLAATFEPFAYSLLFELTAIISLGYGFGHRQMPSQSPIEAPPRRRQPRHDEPEPPRGDGTKSRDDALADLRSLLKAGQSPPSQDWLAERWGVRKGTISKWLDRWETNGDLPGSRRTEGRFKTVVSA